MSHEPLSQSASDVPERDETKKKLYVSTQFLKSHYPFGADRQYSMQTIKRVYNNRKWRFVSEEEKEDCFQCNYETIDQ